MREKVTIQTLGFRKSFYALLPKLWCNGPRITVYDRCYNFYELSLCKYYTYMFKREYVLYFKRTIVIFSIRYSMIQFSLEEGAQRNSEGSPSYERSR